MKSLISVNNKFMSLNVIELINLIKESKYTKGLEVCIDFNNEQELKYLDDLVFEIKKKNLILQIHGDIELEYEKQLKYVKKLESYSDYLGYPIVFTIHTIYNEDLSLSLKKTLEYISKLISGINNDKIIVCLENLDNSKGFSRLSKGKIENLIINDENLYFTYDIGHEIVDYGNITDLNEYMISDIRNVHIHSNSKGIDHMPIYKNDANWNRLIKALTFLIINKYHGNVVYEYDLNLCVGDTIRDRVINYLNSIDYVSSKYEGI